MVKSALFIRTTSLCLIHYLFAPLGRENKTLAQLNESAEAQLGI